MSAKSRKKAKEILFKTLKDEGWEEILFSNGKLNDDSAIIQIVIDAMEKHKNQKPKDVCGHRLI